MIDFRPALERAAGGGRLGPEEGEAILRSGALLEVGEAAHEARRRMNPGGRVSYIIERNINYTNVCITYCTFCAFYRAPGHGESYVLSDDVLHRKIAETVAEGGTGILLQGGHHPDLPLSWYEEMHGRIKERFSIHIHGFSPSELLHVAEVSATPLPWMPLSIRTGCTQRRTRHARGRPTTRSASRAAQARIAKPTAGASTATVKISPSSWSGMARSSSGQHARASSAARLSRHTTQAGGGPSGAPPPASRARAAKGSS